MVLFRAQLEQLISQLQGTFAKDHNTAYALVMRMLNLVISAYYNQGSDNIPVDEIVRDENHWSQYDRFKHRLSLVRKLHVENPGQMKKAFQEAYEVIAHSQPRLPVQFQSGSDVSFDELSSKLSEVFAGGFYSRLADAFQKHFADEDPGATLIGGMGEVLDAAGTNSLPNLALNGLKLYKKVINRLSQTEGRKKFLETLNLVINEVIELLSKRGAWSHSSLHESQDGTKDIFDTVDQCFRAYINSKLSDIHLHVEENENFFKNVLELCNDASLPEASRKVCKNLRSEIFHYFQTDGKPQGFGIINPRLLLDSKTLEDDKQYQMIKQYSSEKLSQALATIEAGNGRRLSGGIFHGINVSLTTWANEKSWIQRLKETFQATAKNDSGSDRSQNRDRALLMGYFEELAQAGEMSGLDKFTNALFALNQTLYLQRPDVSDAKKSKTPTPQKAQEPASGKSKKPSRVEKFSQHPFANSTRIVDPASQLHRDLRRVHYLLRDFANTHADKLKCMLTKSTKITKQDLYYELNLSINYSIGQIAKASYGFSRFPLSLLGKIRSSERQNREHRLAEIANQLQRCHSEHDYVDLLDLIVSNWAQVNRKVRHPWDNQFYKALQTIAKQVVATHVLSPQRFTLEFSIQKLRRIAVYMECMNMHKEKSYLVLQEKIKKIEREQAKRPDELLNEQAAKERNEPKAVENQAEVQRLANDERKVKRFENTLKGQLESQILADLVISTGRLQVKDRDIGRVTAQLADVVGKVNGLAGVANLVRNVGHQYDEANQEADGREASNKITHAGGYLVWSQFAKEAAEKLSKMFAAQIKEMESDNAPVRFAEFCFKRIHASLYAPLPIQAEDFSPSDRLVYAVFTQNEKLSRIPFRKDHYRKAGDVSRFTNTTFQGLVDNVAFVCEKRAPESAAAMSHPQSQPEAQDGANLQIEPIARPIVQAAELFVEPRAFHVKTDNAHSKFSKYGSVPGDVQLATALRRVPLGLFDNRIKLHGLPCSEQDKVDLELAKQVRETNGGMQTQENILRTALAR